VTNSTFVDLESPTIRTRYFGGRRADEIALEMPILPVDAPGLPPPGPSLCAFAAAAGDGGVEPAPAPGAKKKKTKVGRPTGAYLTGIVRSAVYQEGLAVTLTDGTGSYPQELIPGVTFDAAGDPRFGPSPCRLMIFGKCMGPTEVSTRRPFSGNGSRPLWRAWEEAGLPLPGPDLPTYMTHLIRFAPPLAALSRLPRDWVADGLHLFYQDLVACRPEFLLILGPDALKAVFGAKAKISEYKGRETLLEVDARPTPDSPEDRFAVRVVVADHPPAVDRDPDAYPGMAAALRYLSRRMGYDLTPAVVAQDYRAVTTLAELRAAVAESVTASAAGGYVSFDCEWEGRHPTEPGAYVYTVQWSHAPGHARVVYLRRCGGAENTALPAAEAGRLLRQLFEGAPARGARLVAHFGKADLPWLYAAGVDLYPHFVGPKDDPGADGVNAMWAWQKNYFEGAFDTYVAAHAVDESQPLGLEVLTTSVLGLERYDQHVIAWKDAYCKENKISKSALKGYGNCPEDVMTPYAARDADDTGRLYLMYNGDPRTGTRGKLDCDRYKHSCRQIFAVRMRAWAAVAEMERYGLAADLDTHRRLRDVIAARRDELLESLRAEAAWPDFAPTKRSHRIEFLFGEAFSPNQQPVRPPGALSLYLEPYKATETAGGGRLWEEAKDRCEREGIAPVPAADKETLISLSRQHTLAALLLDIDFLSTAMKILFRRPDVVEVVEDDDGMPAHEVHTQGFVACIHHDGRIRTRIGHVETGRYSSSGPNMQNFGSSVDERYDRILGWGEHAPEGSPKRNLNFVSRSIIRATPGWYIVSADLKGAEIAAAGWWSGDAVLMDHARRATLDESDPEWLDLHADLAASTFKLEGTLKEVKKKYKALRVAAKKTRFSHYYGASADTIFRQVLQETKDVTLDQIHELIKGHDKRYPALAAFFEAVRARALSHGWACNPYGGYRRIRVAADNDLRAAQQRELQNWTCQGLVADNISYALGNVWYDLRERRMRSRIVLSVHDSIMVESPPDEVVVVAKDIVPRAMTTDNQFVITDFNGNPVRGPYHFGVDVSVYRSWGVEVPEEEWNPDYAKA